MSETTRERVADRQWQHNALYHWWRSAIVSSVEHESVLARINGESG
jgi:hypothetical protein